MEQWRDVAGYEGIYQVSDQGRVKRVDRGNTMKPVPTKDGYLRVKLCKDGVQWSTTVHRLVAAAFVENKECKPEVNHKNGDKTDNRAANLEWVTHHENVMHACSTGLRNKEEYRKTAIANGKKASRKVRRSDGVEFESLCAAARAVSVSQTAIWNVANGLRPSAGGYSYEYLEV